MSNNNINRALGLDALRGFAILTMFLSGLVPFYKNTLPNWMYHAQVPPPLHKFNPNLPGLTWVDLVFPFFIFSMGAAIPLALTKRIEKGLNTTQIILQTFERFILLAGFAIFIQHVKPYALNPNPTITTWLIALLGFVLLFPVLYRFPNNFNKNNVYVIKATGIVCIVLLLSFLRYPNETGFLLTRSDIIILVLANVAFFGTLLWYFTRNNLLLRLGIFGFLLAFRLGHNEAGFIKEVWNYSPFPWLYTLYYLQYLFVLIPGTIIGDFLVNRMNNKEENIETGLSNLKLKTLCGLMILITVIVLIGLQSRLTLITLIMVIFWTLGVYYILKDVTNINDVLFRKFFYWGIYFLLLGLFFEPYEGGIKKDHPTLSYYFVTVGLAIFSLIAFMIIIDVLKQGKYLDILVANGQNPMVAYAGISNLIPPLLGITGLAELLNLMVINPLMGFVKGLIITFILGIIVKYFTKYKIFLRT
jgi:predicted acyltransferase